jgi:hypothetical protein
MSDNDLVKRLKKWADGEAMAAYGEHLVDHPDEHEGSQISDLIDTLTDRIEELEAKLREMALDCLAADGQAAEAYQAQLAAEAKLEALTKAATKVHHSYWHSTDGVITGMYDLERALRLAELKGETYD